MRLWCQGSEMHRLVLFCFLLELFICTGCKCSPFQPQYPLPYQLKKRVPQTDSFVEFIISWDGWLCAGLFMCSMVGCLPWQSWHVILLLQDLLMRPLVKQPKQMPFSFSSFTLMSRSWAFNISQLSRECLPVCSRRSDFPIVQLQVKRETCNCIVFHPNSHGKVTASSFLFSVLFGIYCHVTLWDGFLVIPKQDLVGCELVFPWM